MAVSTWVPADHHRCWLGAVAFLIAGPTSAGAEDYAFHRDPTYSEVCSGGDCLASYLPAYSDFLVQVLCNFRPPTPSNRWRIDGIELYSPTCDWINHQTNRRNIVVAFDDQGAPYIAPGWTSRLVEDGAIEPLSNAQILSNTYQNIQDGAPVYYSDFTPQDWDAMNTGWPLKPVDLFAADAICALGIFEPLYGMRLALKNGNVVEHYSPACAADNPSTGEREPLVLFDAMGRGFLVNENLANRLAEAAQ